MSVELEYESMRTRGDWMVALQPHRLPVDVVAFRIPLVEHLQVGRQSDPHRSGASDAAH